MKVPNALCISLQEAKSLLQNFGIKFNFTLEVNSSVFFFLRKKYHHTHYLLESTKMVDLTRTQMLSKDP
jgi:hypothetical protein